MSKHLPNLCIIIIALAAVAFLPQAGRAENPPQYLSQWGSNGTGDGQFIFADGIAVYGSYAYVIDLYNRVQKFTTDGTYILKWGQEGPNGNAEGQFSGASGITVDGAGNVYVADMGNHRVQKFDASGVFITLWGSRGSATGQFNYCYDIQYSAFNSLLYVSDQFNGRVQVFNVMGTFQYAWGSVGTGDAQFNIIFGIGIDPRNGNVFTVERNSANIVRVQKFTSTGTFLKKWGSGGTGPGEFNFPIKIAVGLDGTVYVTETNSDRVQMFTDEGVYLGQWGTHGSGPGQFNMPYGIALDESGCVYVTDHYNQRVQKFGPAVVSAKTTTWGRVKALYR
ncbi:MAG: 6-bladed beta-propeller [Candidatus Kerfeldbacteria bacterium]